MPKQPDIPRIKKQTDAAAMLRISTRRLRDHEKAPWWREEFRTDADGYDVVAIARGQLLHEREATGVLPKDELDRLQADKLRAAVGRELHREGIERLQLEELQRQKERELGNILPASVYAAFLREWLAMCRREIENISFEIARHAPKALRSLLHSDDKKKPSKLQKLIRSKLDKLERWLQDGETEVARGARS